MLAALAYNLAKAGRLEDSRRYARRLQETTRSNVSPYHLAVVALGFGDARRAREQLLASWDDRSLWLPWLRFDHRLAPLRPAIGPLLERLRLPPVVDAEPRRSP